MTSNKIRLEFENSKPIFKTENTIRGDKHDHDQQY